VDEFGSKKIARVKKLIFDQAKVSIALKVSQVGVTLIILGLSC